MTNEAVKVNTKFEIIKYGMPGFKSQLDSFIATSLTNPIYSSQFCDYYRELGHEPQENRSIIVGSPGKELVALLFSTPTQPGVKNHQISYFGLPSALLVSRTAAIEEVNGATHILLQELNNSNILVTNGRIRNPHDFLIDTHALRSNKIEKLFFSDSKVTLKFDRILDLSRSPESVRSEYSKSARDAIKNQSLDIKLISSESSQDAIEYEFESLKRLHFLSSGKLTRSERSWDLQLQMIQNGSGVIVSGSTEKKVMTSALFMINSDAAFYGVSASEPSQERDGLSHQLIDFAIREFPKLGIHNIWMGAQHSSVTVQVSKKEQQIEEFKSYFGGSLHTSLIARSEYLIES
jgi:hypothetical protein